MIMGLGGHQVCTCRESSCSPQRSEAETLLLEGLGCRGFGLKGLRALEFRAQGVKGLGVHIATEGSQLSAVMVAKLAPRLLSGFTLASHKPNFENLCLQRP